MVSGFEIKKELSQEQGSAFKDMALLK